MKITYIGHSGFLIEWENCCWLFDYYQGEVPEVAPEKKMFVFSSHKHEDHFNPEVFRLCERYKDIEFILSSDIRLKNILSNINNVSEKDKLAEVGDTAEKVAPTGIGASAGQDKLVDAGASSVLADKIISVKPSVQYELYDKDQQRIALATLKSTDCGVAFLLQYQGKIIYHAGDLNMWVWKRGTKQENNNMMARYNREMEKLRDIPVDIAFVPLDSRLEDYYYMGLEGFLNSARARYVFPMHFCGEPSVIERFKQERAMSIRDTRIMDISRKGQMWDIDI